jgi:hypothetical protein
VPANSQLIATSDVEVYHVYLEGHFLARAATEKASLRLARRRRRQKLLDLDADFAETHRQLARAFASGESPPNDSSAANTNTMF